MGEHVRCICGRKWVYTWRLNTKKITFFQQKKDVSTICTKVQFHTWHIARCSGDMQIDNFIRDTLQNALGTCRLTIQNYKVSCTSLLINEKVKITFLNGDFYIDLSLIKSWWLKCWTKNNNVKHFLFDLPHLGKWTTTVFIDTHNKYSVTSLTSVGLFLYPFLRLIQICFLFVENIYIYCCSSSYVYCEIINDGKTRISRTTREK